MWWANEVLARLRGFFGGRTGHGKHMVADLKNTVGQGRLQIAPEAAQPDPPIDKLMRVKLCEPTAYRNPMNWALSKRAQTHMQCAANADSPDVAGCRKVYCPEALRVINSTAILLNATHRAEMEPPPIPPRPPAAP